MPSIHISLTAEKIFHITGNIWITNSLLTSWIVMLFVIAFSIFATKKLALVPNNLQSIAEIIIEGIWNLFSSILRDKINVYFPLIATYFIFIITLNWAGLFPGIGTIGLESIEEGHRAFIPIFRAGTADLNTTLALAIIAMLVIQISGLRTLGASYIKKFVNFSNPIYFFVGVLEIISEFSKIISFAFRLFGNIFAGEVLLTVIAFLMPVFAPLPFMGLELFVGFIQALVFSMLTAVFLSLATTKTSH